MQSSGTDTSIEAPEILFEDNHLMVVRKPFGMLAQGDDSGDTNLLDWCKDKIREQTGKEGNIYATVLHRLDRPVGGLIAVAKTSKAAGRLSEDFKHKLNEKWYLAITEGLPEQPEDTLRHFLYKIPGKNIVRANTQPKKDDAKESLLYYRTLRVIGERALLEVFPLTGRQHQIRVQLAKMNAPIVGDKKYGKTKFQPDRSIALFARQLAFKHPTKRQKMRFVLPLPEEREPWRSFIENLEDDVVV